MVMRNPFYRLPDDEYVPDFSRPLLDPWRVQRIPFNPNAGGYELLPYIPRKHGPPMSRNLPARWDDPPVRKVLYGAASDASAPEANGGYPGGEPDWEAAMRDSLRGMQEDIARQNQIYSGFDPDARQRVAPQHERRTDVPMRVPPLPGSSAPPLLAEWPVPGYGKLNEADPARRQGAGTFGSRQSSHTGIDITAPEGTPIVAAADGRVVNILPNPSETYGWQVVLDHGGYFFTQSGHLGSIAVNMGDKVRAGQVIGTVGRSGNVPEKADSHLHFEVRTGSERPRRAGGKVSDPLDALPHPYNPR